MKKIMKKTAALLCAAAMLVTAGGGAAMSAFAEKKEEVTMNIYTDSNGIDWIEVSGNINISDYPGYSYLKLTGDTVINVDTNQTLHKLGNESKYKLTINGSHTLYCSQSIKADQMNINADVYADEVIGNNIRLEGNKLLAARVSANDLVINNGDLNERDERGLNVYGEMTVNSGFAGMTLFSGRQLTVNGGRVRIKTLDLHRTDKHMSNFGMDDKPASHWTGHEPLYINEPAHLDSDELVTKYEFSKEKVGGENYYCNAVREAWVVDKKGNTPTKVVITSDLTGSVRINRSSIVAGTRLELFKDGLVAKIADNALHFTWQRSDGASYPDSSTKWTNVGYDSDYYAQADDVGHYVRAIVTMPGAGGILYSPPMPVNKMKWQIEPTRAEAVYKDGKLYIKNGSVNQEYIVLPARKEISALTDSDWSKAVSPETGGEFTVNFTKDVTNYIYTRCKEDKSHFVGTQVYGTPVYCGTYTYLQDFIITPEGNELDGDYYISKAGDVIKLTVTPVPDNPTNFNGVYGQNWLLSGYHDSEAGSFYEDEACTKKLEDSKPYYTAYLKINEPRNNYTVEVQHTKGYNDLVYSSIKFMVADSSGKFKPDSISATEITLPKGFVTNDGVEPDVYPKNSDISGVVFKCTTEGAEHPPKVYLNEETGNIMADADEAEIGEYYFTPYIGETKLMGGIRVNVIKDTVTVHFIPGSGASGEMPDMEVAIGSEITLPGCTFIPPEGYVFEEWVNDEEDMGYAVMDKVIVYNDITFRAGWIACEHNIVKVERIEPTCQFDGMKEHFKCSRCGTLYTDSEGNNTVSYEDLVIPKLPHNWDGGKITTPATETTPGVITFTCLVCGETNEVPYSFGNEDKILVKKGDVNGDGKIDIEDAVMVINHINGVKALTDDEYNRANVDANNDVDIEDAVAIIAHVNGVKVIE